MKAAMISAKDSECVRELLTKAAEEMLKLQDRYGNNAGKAGGLRKPMVDERECCCSLF